MSASIGIGRQRTQGNVLARTRYIDAEVPYETLQGPFGINDEPITQWSIRPRRKITSLIAHGTPRDARFGTSEVDVCIVRNDQQPRNAFGASESTASARFDDDKRRLSGCEYSLVVTMA
jgi:hypothetical protein